MKTETENLLLWTEHPWFPASWPKFTCWNPNPQCNGIQRCSLSELIGVTIEGETTVKGLVALEEERKRNRAPLLHAFIWERPCEDLVRRGPSTGRDRKRALSRTRPWWHPDLWLGVFQSRVFSHSSLRAQVSVKWLSQSRQDTKYWVELPKQIDLCSSLILGA